MTDAARLLLALAISPYVRRIRLTFITSLLVITAIPLAYAQTFTVLYSFTDQSDGGVPKTGLSMDAGGNLYGTTSRGGYFSGTQICQLYGCGVIFKLQHRGSNWIFSSLYQFTDGSDGAVPSSRVVFGHDGALYGTTFQGGNKTGDCQVLDGCGLVFRLMPQPTICRTTRCSWLETPVWTFQDPVNHGGQPQGELLLDAVGNIYGTGTIGGSSHCGDGLGCGVLYQLTHSGGTWTASIVHAFTPTVSNPMTGVVMDSAGNFFGTSTSYDFGNSGTIYELVNNGSGYTETALFMFLLRQNGFNVQAGLTFDQLGDLIGGTVAGGQTNFGTVFELTPLGGIRWDFSTIYTFQQAAGGPYANLTMDSAGNLYGTAYHDGAGRVGSVFKLTHTDQGWTYTDLHDFHITDGEYPISSVLVDANGNLYGTTSQGGAYGYGTVWEITP